MKDVDENPYDGLPGLLWAHGDKKQARRVFEAIQRNGGTLPEFYHYAPLMDWPVVNLDDMLTDPAADALFKEPGTLIAAGGWSRPAGSFPSRCTNCDGHGHRCYLEYAHAGDHKYTLEETMTDHELPPKHVHSQGTRILADNTVEKFLNEKIENIQEQIAFIDKANEERRKKIDADSRTRAQLRRDENELHAALATLKSVKARNKGEGRVQSS